MKTKQDLDKGTETSKGDLSVGRGRVDNNECRYTKVTTDKGRTALILLSSAMSQN